MTTSMFTHFAGFRKTMNKIPVAKTLSRTKKTFSCTALDQKSCNHLKSYDFSTFHNLLRLFGWFARAIQHLWWKKCCDIM